MDSTEELIARADYIKASAEADYKRNRFHKTMLWAVIVCMLVIGTLTLITLNTIDRNHSSGGVKLTAICQSIPQCEHRLAQLEKK